MVWTTFGGIEVSPTRHQGVYRRRDGRYLIRARVKDPKTGKQRPFNITVEAKNDDDALRLLVERKQGIREGGTQTKRSQTRFAAFAATVMEERPRVRSNSTRAKWANMVRHLIEDEFPVTYDDGRTETRSFGPMFIDQIGHVEIRAWRKHLDGLVASGEKGWGIALANDLIRHFKLIMRIAANEPHCLIPKACDWLEPLDTSTYDPHPIENPNALPPEHVRTFLAKARVLYPQHFAMIVLSFTFGLRPSSLRSLRRKGPNADLDWQTGRLVIRRSQTIGDPMGKNKVRASDELYLPPEILSVLRWHGRNLETAAMRGSDLLFPSEKGGFRARSVLDKPFRAICKAIGIKQRLTPGIGPRRTTKDVMRKGGIDHVVGAAMSLHATAAMHLHYSTVRGDEKLEAARKISKAYGLKAKKGAKVVPMRRAELQPEPVRTKPKYEIDGVIRTLKGWAEVSGINATTLHYRTLRGLSIAEAIALGPGKTGKALPMPGTVEAAHGSGVTSGVKVAS